VHAPRVQQQLRLQSCKQLQMRQPRKPLLLALFHTLLLRVAGRPTDPTS
jgi:hypothetical protein